MHALYTVVACSTTAVGLLNNHTTIVHRAIEYSGNQTIAAQPLAAGEELLR
jgi:hypothetical protein